jgi:hypothetical protein
MNAAVAARRCHWWGPVTSFLFVVNEELLLH